MSTLFYSSKFNNIRNRFYSLSTITSTAKKESRSETKRKKEVEKAAEQEAKLNKKVAKSLRESHAVKIRNYFNSNPQLSAIKNQIPEKYLQLKRITPSDNSYLIDSSVAKEAASLILPRIRDKTDQLICETNAGLGLITEELLKNNVAPVRVYESCAEFQDILKMRLKDYHGNFELFTKDIFLVYRYEYFDKHDNGNRVEQLWNGVPRKEWDDDPSLTIIGCMFNLNFIRFLIKSLVLQSYIMQFGRLQLFTFIKPKDYVILTAGPHLNLHTYQITSVFFNLFFDIELLGKYPKEIFLPWQSNKVLKYRRYAAQVDPDMMYFVNINFKRKLPISSEYFQQFYAFVRQFFGRGSTRIIPVMEKWVPGSGLEVFVPKFNHKNYFNNIDIYTKFGELTPDQVLYIFEEMISNPEYNKSPFLAMVENQFVKSETIESSLDDQLEKHIANNNINVKIG